MAHSFSIKRIKMSDQHLIVINVRREFYKINLLNK